MRILLVSEGKHELSGALQTLVRRLLPDKATFEVRQVKDLPLRVHGKGDGLFKVAIGWLLFAQHEQFDALVLTVDEDGVRNRRRQFESAQTSLKTPLPRALGLAIRTFDAWMLADEVALSEVCRLTIQAQPSPELIDDPKALCIALRDESGLDVGLAEMYARLAEVIRLHILEARCGEGFSAFARRVRDLTL